MDPTIDAMLIVYAAALMRHRQHLEDGCDRRAWHVLACHLIERAVWSANSTEESVHDGRPLWFNPNCSARTTTDAKARAARLIWLRRPNVDLPKPERHRN